MHKQFSHSQQTQSNVGADSAYTQTIPLNIHCDGTRSHSTIKLRHISIPRLLFLSLLLIHISDHQFPSIEYQRISSSILEVILISLTFSGIALRAVSDQGIIDPVLVLPHHQITIQVPESQEQFCEFAVVILGQNIEISHHQLSRAIIPTQSI